jgi:hypothetical protein
MINGVVVIILSVLVIVVCARRDAWIQKYDDLKKDAITQGHAQYNPTNGNWEWKR